jgi:hypothetical protein
MNGERAPLDERWTFDGIFILGGGVIMALVVAPIALALAVDPYVGGSAAGMTWFIATGYESGLIPQLKWEIRRRVRPSIVVIEEDEL